VIKLGDERVTARAYARACLLTSIDSAYERVVFNDTMTERELAEVLRHIRKDADRCARMLGYDPRG
jgi:hypothetical protein